MSSHYSKDEVWASARFIWENTPHITDRELIEQLKTGYGNAAPKSSGTISKRRKKENWDKNSLVQTSKKDMDLEANSDGSKPEWKQKPQNTHLIPSKTNKAENLESDTELEAAGSKIEGIVESVVIDAQGRAKIIKNTRRRFDNLGQLFDQALIAALSLQGYANAASEDPKAGEQVQKALLLSESLSSTVGNLAKSLKVIAEVEMPLCGITADDFKQSDQDRRLNALAALGNIHEQEQAARARLIPELHARLLEIEKTAESEYFGIQCNDQQPQIQSDVVDYTALD
ncbi:hypothetical protein [Psychrobacter sp. SMN/5/1215-MNA-CIBAN-0208]|uniref:hypothetical protein n=1 Tax=Psychrobacter sp. SMN/5/1215-MNA-CIBAN-0208 TaxID=3140442 RepID=UPI00333448EA